jgi:hypothetical protein
VNAKVGFIVIQGSAEKIKRSDISSLKVLHRNETTVINTGGKLLHPQENFDVFLTGIDTSGKILLKPSPEENSRRRKISLKSQPGKQGQTHADVERLVFVISVDDITKEANQINLEHIV